MTVCEDLDALGEENHTEFHSDDGTDSEDSGDDPDAVTEAIQMTTRSNEEPCFRDSVLNQDMDFAPTVSKHFFNFFTVFVSSNLELFHFIYSHIYYTYLLI